MNKDIFWGGSMAIVGIGAFIWAAQDSLFQKETELSPSPNIHSQEKPSISPTPTINASERIKKAQNAVQNGNFEYAITLVENEIKTAETLNILIESYIAQGLFIDAETYIKELLAIENNEENISGYIRVLLLKGDVTSAKSLLQKLSTKTSEKTFYQLIIAVTENKNEEVKKLAAQLLAYDDYEKIGTVFLDVYKTYESFQDGSPHYLKTMLANVLKTLNFHALTISYIKPTLQEYPEYRDAWIVLGNSYLALKKYEVAERMLEKAVSLDPTHPISPYLLGMTLYELGQAEDAIEQIKNAIKNGYNQRGKAERYIADMYFAQEKYEQALEHYQYILNEGEPTVSDYTKSVYIALQELKSPQLALSFSENAATDMPKNPAVLTLKAWTLIEKGKTIEAEQLLLKLQKEYGKTPEILLYLGRVYEKKKEYNTAFETYKECFEIKEGSAVSMECSQKYESLRIQLQDE